MTKNRVSLLLLTAFAYLFFSETAFAQPDRWQQRIKYEMNIDFDAVKSQYSGKQKISYTNNSPDTLDKVFYHLYLNAFQPGSLMDVRSRTISDPDARVKDRIFKLKPEEIGFEKIKSLKHNGKPVKFHVEGTILEVSLEEKILPKTQHTFELEFDAQLPVQIRRTGRKNKEGVEFSVAQWYPKMAEYDYEGWHTSPYIAREFYGVWGDFDVKITLDAAYTIGATGYLQNPDKIGHGYSVKQINHKPGSKLTWHFSAPNVHDFVWAADRNYQHDIVKVDDQLDLHFFYKTDSLHYWKEMQPMAVRAFNYMNQNYGRYPYKQYSVIQGGDGGMEYPMATLILGYGKLAGLVGVTVHESIHSWFQMILGNNESKYGWMDEGFTTYAENEVMANLFPSRKNPQSGAFNAYRRLVESGLEEPLTTHADHFNTNRAYSTASYSKGALVLNQLNYIMGETDFRKGMLRYFNEWKFKHPNPTDFKRVMEKTSGLELDWFFENWVGTTKKIDYGIKEVYEGQNQTTEVVLSRIGQLPMPLDVVVTYKDKSTENFYIPLDLMRGEKKENLYGKTTLLGDWGWTYTEYTFRISKPLSDISGIEIDPSKRMSDIDPSNNYYPIGPKSERAESPRIIGND